MQDKYNVLIIGNCVYLHPIHTTQPKSVATHSDKNASKHNISQKWTLYSVNNVISTNECTVESRYVKIGLLEISVKSNFCGSPVLNMYCK